MKRRTGGGLTWKGARGSQDRQKGAVSVEGSCTSNSVCFGGTVRSSMCLGASVRELGAVDSC